MNTINDGCIQWEKEQTQGSGELASSFTDMGDWWHIC